jgi:hypothetical protein
MFTHLNPIVDFDYTTESPKIKSRIINKTKIENTDEF